MRCNYGNYLRQAMLWLMAMFISVAVHAQSNRLNADLPVPTLEVENGPGTFRLRIAKAVHACSDGVLQITLPAGFRYAPNSMVYAEGITARGAVTVTDNVVTVPINIEAGATSSYGELAFGVEALCGVGLDGGNNLTYALTGCGISGTETKTSNTVNIRFAVLQVTVSPASTAGLIGDQRSRTITVRNVGNASVPGFVLNADYGAGLVRESSNVAAPWSYNDNVYTYAGSLAPNAAVSFNETVRINGCGNLNTTFEAFYGQHNDCEPGDQNEAEASIEIDRTIRPNMVITPKTTPVIGCLGQSYRHEWTIKNEGNGRASSIVLTINGGSGSTISAVAMTSGTVTAGPGANQYTISTLEPGAEETISFEQFYPLPSQACINGAHVIGNTSYELSYAHAESCAVGGGTPAYTIGNTETKPALRFAISGENVGEVDIIEGQDYQASFLMSDWSIPEEGLDPDAYVEFTVELSDGLDLDPSALQLMNGGTPVNGTVTQNGNVYTFRVNPADVDFSSGNISLQFPLGLSCPLTNGDPWYTVSASLARDPNCPESINFCAETVNLYGHCGTDCPEGGMGRGRATLKRLTLGTYTNMDDVDTRAFIAGDELEISQRGTVRSGTTATTWTWGGVFGVDISGLSSLSLEAVANSGKVIVNPNDPLPITFDNLEVLDQGGHLFINLPAATGGFAGFQDGDEVVASLVIKSMTPNASTGLKEFPTVYGLHDDDADIGISDLHSCGFSYRATGYYGSTIVTVGDEASTNLANCAEGVSPVAYEVRFGVAGKNYRNALFPNETREIAAPQNVSFDVSAGLTMTGYELEILGQGVSARRDVAIAPISGGSTGNLNLANEIAALLGTATLDEGFTVRVYPKVSIDCDAGADETVKIAMSVNGIFHYNTVNYVPGNVSTAERTLTYHTDNDKLLIQPVLNNYQTTARNIEWTVEVYNSSGFRTFNNVWLAYNAPANVNITAIEVVNQAGQPTGTTITPNANGIFELGNVTPNQVAYYKIKGNFTGNDCGRGDIQIITGNQCDGYPADPATTTCRQSTPLSVSYEPVMPLLQTSVVTYPTPSRTDDTWELCEELTYVVEINNAGGQASALTVTIPVKEGMEFVVGQTQVTPAFTGNTVPAFTAIDPANIDVSSGTSAVITIPSTLISTLENAQKFHLSFTVKLDGCNFPSGQSISVTPAGRSICGQNIAGERLVIIGTDRIIIAGSPADLPIVEMTSDVSVDTEQSLTDNILRGRFSTVINNVGVDQFGNTTDDNISEEYSYELQLPADWFLDYTTIQDIVPVGVMVYDPTNSDEANGRYVFKVASDVPVGGRINLSNVRIRYEGAIGSLICDQSFGDVEQRLFARYTPESDCDPALICAEQELVLVQHKTDFSLRRPSTPVGDPVHVFCENGDPTLEDVQYTIIPAVEDQNRLEWFETAVSTTPLALITVLEDGKTYYARKRLIDGLNCWSDALAVTVYLDKDLDITISAAGNQTQKYNVRWFDLTGTPLVSGRTTGQWEVVSVVPLPGYQNASVTFSALNNNVTRVTIPNNSEVTLRWNVTNLCGTFSEEITVRSNTAVLTLDKSAGTVQHENADGLDRAGDKITYTFTITNNSGSRVNNVALTDPMFAAADIEFVSYSGSGTYGESLDIGESVVFTATHTITQPNMDAAVVDNTATVRGQNLQGGNLNPVTDRVTVNLTPTPALTLVKRIKTINGTDAAGQTLVYEFTLRNTGTVTINDLRITDTKLNLHNVALNPASLAPGEDLVYEAPAYALTVADLDAGFVRNQATVSGLPAHVQNGVRHNVISDTGTDRNGDDITDPAGDDTDGNNNLLDDPTILDLEQKPSLSLSKVANTSGLSNPVVAGDEVTYTFKVTNTGNVTLTDIAISEVDFTGTGIVPDFADFTFGGNSGSSSEGTLAPNEVATYSFVYTLTQEDINAGGVDNRASVTGTPPTTNPSDPAGPIPPVESTPDPDNPGGGTGNTPGKDTEVDLPAVPSLTFTKASALTDDADNNSEVSEGDELTYTFVVTNTGNVTLTDVTITDTDLPGLSGLTYVWPNPAEEGVLLPGEHVRAEATYRVTLSDVNNGHIANQALVSVETPPSSPDIPDTRSNDPDTPDEPEDETVVEVPQHPSLTLVKSAGDIVDANNDNRQSAGDEITYTFTVSNTGNVTVSSISVIDPLFAAPNEAVSIDVVDGSYSGTGAYSSLLNPGESVQYSATYTLTQTNMDAGEVENRATVSGEDPKGASVEDDSDTGTNPDGSTVTDPGNTDSDGDSDPGNDPTVRELVQSPSLTFTKSDALSNDVDNNSEVSEGDELTYTFVVTNTGNVTLTDVDITDTDLPGLSGLTYFWPNPAEEGVLLPGEHVRATATYIVTLDDVNNGRIANQALVSVETPPGAPDIPDTPSDDPDTPDTPDDETVVDIPQHPSLTFTKSDALTNDADNNNEVSEGDELTYTFVVTNTGNVTLTDVAISDPLPNLGTIVYAWPDASNAGVLLPSQSVTATATYTVTLADVNNGRIVNQALVSVETPPGAPDIPDTPSDDPDTPDTPDDETVVDIPRHPSLTFTKSDALTNDADNNNEVSEGDELTYTFVVTNTGNVTLTDVAITDTDLPGLSGLTYFWPNPAEEGVLLPGEHVRATATYTVTLTDVNNGRVVNQALVDATTPTGVPNIEDQPSDDPDTPDTPDDETVVDIPRHPSLTFTKSDALTNDADNNNEVSEGDELTYTFVVTNTGNVTLTDVAISDPLPNLGTIVYAWPDASNAGVLLPGEHVTATAQYTVTLADVNNGRVVNQALVDATTPTGVPNIEDQPSDDPDTPDTPDDETVVDIPRHPSLTFTKSDALTNDADNNNEVSEGDELTYTFVVTNTGNVTLTDVAISDPLPNLGTITYVWPDANNAGMLLPSQRVTATATYTVTLADVNNGRIVNQALVSVETPPGAPDIPDTPSNDPDTPTPDDETVVVIPQHPSLTFTKSDALTNDADNNNEVSEDDELTYTFVVTNTGNVTLSNVAISDPLPNLGTIVYTWPDANNAGVLLPSQSVTATATYTVTLADVNNGRIVNHALVSVETPPGAPDIPDTPSDDPDTPTPDDETVVVIPQHPSLTFTKSDALTNDADNNNEVSEGDELTYTFVVTNTGNVTLSNVSISDPLPNLGAITYVWPDANNAGMLLPSQRVTATATYTVTLADVNNGRIVNQALVSVETPPTAPDIPDTPSDDPDTPDTPDDETVVVIPQRPSLTFTKSDALTNDADNNNEVSEGDELTYTFVVTNTGNVTLSNVAISDPLPNLGAIVYTWPDASNAGVLLPSQSVTATATYTVTLADVNNGRIVNHALVSIDTPPTAPDIPDTPSDDPDTPAPDDETVITVPQYPELTLIKSASTVVDRNNDNRHSVGDEITYTFVLTNTGNVTVNELTLTDAKLGLNEVDLPQTSLVPGGTTTYTAVYRLTQEDLDAGEIINQALAKGETIHGIPVSDDSDAGTNPDGSTITTPGTEDSDDDGDPGNDPTVTELIQSAAIQVVKTAVMDERYRYVGERIEYQIEVRNIGNVTVSNILVSDDNADTPEVGTIAELRVGASEVLTAYHTITQADMDRGYVSNIANAIGKDPKGNEVEDESESGNTPEPGDPFDPACDDCTITPLPAKPIEAINDGEFAINGSTGGSTPPVFDNDLLNNIKVNPNEVIFTWLDDAPEGFTLNPDGTITVESGTPRVTHTIRYRICEVRNPFNCDEATVTVVVEVAPIEAIDDSFTMPWSRGSVTTPSVLDNDRLDGKALNPADVVLTPGTPSDPGLRMNPDGTITIAPSTRPGRYEYPYTICEVLNPTNCSSAIAVIVIEAEGLFIPNVFTPNGDGTNDTFEIVGIEGYDKVGVVIINRWGNEVYRSENYDNTWNGGTLNEGTYYYIITAHKGGNSETLKGWVLIKKR